MSSDLLGIIGWGAAGLVAGVGYKVAHLKLMKSNNAFKLAPKTDILWQNDELFNLCLRLQRFKHIDKFNFEQAIVNMDRLLYFEDIMQNEDFSLQVDDKRFAYGHFETTLDHLKKLYTTAHKQATPKQVVQIKRLYTEITELLQTIWLRILSKLNTE